ncbi:cilia- and flagella-associated protein 251 [Manihot esculenta]|uniref:Uncharacterized protein n=2 Tax=Manihot esculenta TaxID=3983 RepID=A0A2C9U0Q1_MANES|nr:cilia- and flagella-associated protein 251 [Manihot esculenta]XP_043809423.1 cilia- and flagella-associated protein 251 [Manihot esculenta]XP_043809424.1 cilia- and flagella-associated protein 251 [Manihot esculenta]XP_043809425.1 cilia- and flagella-associated protein 251 [Manihot esculenta]OAY23044.1 hypothetical protein MANES_18G047300v8 [Manihot esculenta]OAY23065.2 hypothetical protein MANES_18G047300v8 [Manihot esculenta]
MEDKTRPSNTPSNYVTLQQLQERWIKEQQRKLEKKEEEQSHTENLELQNEEKDPNPQVHPLKDAQENRRNSKRYNRHRNRNLTDTGFGGCPKENHLVSAVVEGHEGESTAKATKSNDLGDKKKKKWNKKLQKKGREKQEGAEEEEKEKTIKDREARSQGEYQEKVVREPRAQLVKSEENTLVMRYEKRRDARLDYRQKNTSVVEKSGGIVKNVVEVENAVEENQETPKIERKLEDLSIKNESKKEKEKTIKDREARSQGEYQEKVVREPRAQHVKSEENTLVMRYEKRRDARLDYRRKNTSVVETSGGIVKNVVEVENAVEENQETPKIERKLEDLSIKNESNSSETQNRVVNRRNNEHRGYTRIDNWTANRRYFGYRGYNGGVNRRNGQHGGSYGRFNHYAEQKGRSGGMVWVKKEEVADAGEGSEIKASATQ